MSHTQGSTERLALVLCTTTHLEVQGELQDRDVQVHLCEVALSRSSTTKVGCVGRSQAESSGEQGRQLHGEDVGWSDAVPTLYLVECSAAEQNQCAESKNV
jgi:hypothetical protein